MTLGQIDYVNNTINPNDFFNKQTLGQATQYNPTSFGIEPTQTNFTNTLGSLMQQNQTPSWENAIKNINYGISSLGTLGSIYLGFKNYNLAKDQLDIAKEQWARAKAEADRIASVRQKLTKSYMGE